MPTQLVADQNTLSDALGTFAPGMLLVGDSITFSDAVIAAGRVVLIPASFSDRLFLTDAIAISTAGLGLVFGDSLNFSDSIKTSRTQANNVTDSLTIADSLSICLWLAIGVADALTISDAVVATPASIFVPLTELVADTLVFSDSVSFVNPTAAMLFSDTMPVLQDSILVIFQTTLNPYLRRYLNDVN